jgi:histidine ammonia-lyase
MEMLTACQAIDFREKALLGEKTKLAYAFIRKQIPFIEADEIMYPYLHLIESILINEDFVNALSIGVETYEYKDKH